MKSQPTEWKKILGNHIFDKGLIFQNIQIAHKSEQQKKKKKKSYLKMDRGSAQTLFQRRHADGRQGHEKILNITKYQGNTNKCHNEILLYTCYNGYH